MTKRENIDNPNSCWNKARDDEQVFILLERDEAMAATLRSWADNRIRLEIDKSTSPKITAARRLADMLDRITLKKYSDKLREERNVLRKTNRRRDSEG